MFAFNVSAEIKIVFLNGIDGYPQKSELSVNKIRAILEGSGYISKMRAAGVKIGSFQNPGDGFFDDKIELLEQAKLSGSALTIAKQTDPLAKADGGQLYSDTLGQLYNNKNINGSADSEKARHVYSVVRNLSKFIKDEILVKNNKLIIVAHSQGNFFSEAVAGYVSVGESIAQQKILNDNLRFVGVASVAASTPTGRYISAREDVALNLHFATTSLVSNFSILPRNIKFCVDLDPVCMPYLQTTIDSSVHGFQETYTSDLYDKITGKQVNKILAELINDSFNELNLPTATISILSTTAQAGSGILFQLNVTYSPNGTISEAEWDFGDGTVQMGTASQITHTYKVADTYTVRLKIKDIKGVTNSTSTTVTVASNNSILSTFQSGFYGSGNDGNGGTCYYKNSATAIVATNEYAMSEARYCLDVTRTAWVLSINSATEIFTPSGWISRNSPTVQFNTDSSGVFKYGGSEFGNVGITPLTVGATFPTGAKAFTKGITNTRDEYVVWHSNPTNNYLYTHAPNIASMMSQWNTSQNGQSTLSRTKGFGWAFDTPSSPTALSGVARYYDIAVAPICTNVGCSRAVVASATWIRTPFADGTDSIELRTPVGFTDMNLSGNTGQKVVYFKRPLDAGVLEGYRELSGATRNFNSYNPTHFDAQLLNLSLPKTVN